MNGCAESGWILCAGKNIIHNNMDVRNMDGWILCVGKKIYIHNNMFPPFPSPKRPRAARRGEARMWNLVIVLKVAMLEM
jgi:hypothetical protein